MKTKLIYSLLLFALCFLNCSKDDSNPKPDPIVEVPDPEIPIEEDPAVVLAAERAVTITAITSSNCKIWRINSAVLSNNSGSFDISSNFNVLDDEFTFCNTPSTIAKATNEFEGSLEWRKGNEIEYQGEDLKGTLLDFYVSPTVYSYNFLAESSTALTSIDADFEFSLKENNEIEGTFTFIDGASMLVSLVPKMENDYRTVPTGLLEFTESFTFESNAVSSNAPGMVGSYSDNSIFIATREDAFRNESGNPERLIKYSLDNNSRSEKLYYNFDFVSKQLHIINNELKVVGGRRVNTYDLQLQNDPTSSQNYAQGLGTDFLAFSRFGSCTIDNDIFIVGGDLDNTFADRIFKYNTQLEVLSELASLPEKRFGARAEIVNDKLYVFGGTEEFSTGPSKNTIYVYDLKTGEITIESMPSAIGLTYTGKFENLIFVAGQNITWDPTYVSIGNDPYVGVYDTSTGTFTELQTNLNSPENETIHGMAVFNNKIFIIYGQDGEFVEGQLQSWSVLEATF